MGDFLSALNPESIGTRIREVRGRLTQQQFADLLGVGRVSVARYETGARVPDAEFIQVLNEKLGVDPIWLLTGKGPPPGEQAFVLQDGEATLLAGYRALDARGKAGVMALIGGMTSEDSSPQKRTKVVQKAMAPGTMQFGFVENFNPPKDRKK